MRSLIISAAALGLAAPSIAQEEGGYDPEALSWLAGCWEGRGFGGRGAECWIKGEDGRYSGVFLLEHDGAQTLTEIMWIDEVGLRLKHFNPDLTAWEAVDETVDFAFVEMSETGVRFEGMDYRREGEDGLVIELNLAEEGGPPRIETFTYQRVR